jgi:Ferredoxin-dependent bilin reductase
MTIRMNWYHVLLIPSICHSYIAVVTTSRYCRHSNQYNNRYPSSFLNRPFNLIQRHVFVNDKPSDFEISNTLSLEKGLYRPFAEYAWQQLIQTHEQNLSPVQVPMELGYKETVAPGPKGNSTVRITIQAATSSNATNFAGSIQYARYALIETIQTSANDNINTDGIQVLNMVIIPYKHTGLPVFGADFVALPGNKHLLLLDAQPVCDRDCDDGNGYLYEDWFQQWYERNDIHRQFEWGGDLPEPVQQYVSKYALWTRFIGSSEATSIRNSTNTNPIDTIRGPVMDVFMDHFQTYMQLLNHYESSSVQTSDYTNSSRLQGYLTYRLDNDPARPMLKRLFGTEWTEQALHDILFPIHLF